jgi:hypothetical protein
MKNTSTGLHDRAKTALLVDLQQEVGELVLNITFSLQSLF